MNKPETDWIKIGQNSDTRSLREEIKKLRIAWPGRWDYLVVPCKTQSARDYELYLRHR